MSVYGWVGEAFALEAFEDHRPCAGQLVLVLVGGQLPLARESIELTLLYACFLFPSESSTPAPRHASPWLQGVLRGNSLIGPTPSGTPTLNISTLVGSSGLGPGSTYREVTFLQLGSPAICVCVCLMSV